MYRLIIFKFIREITMKNYWLTDRLLTHFSILPKSIFSAENPRGVCTSINNRKAKIKILTTTSIMRSAIRELGYRYVTIFGVLTLISVAVRVDVTC